MDLPWVYHGLPWVYHDLQWIYHDLPWVCHGHGSGFPQHCDADMSLLTEIFINRLFPGVVYHNYCEVV